MYSPEGIFLLWDYFLCLKDLTPARNRSTTVVWGLRVCMEAQTCFIHMCISINTGREISRHLWKLIIWATKLHIGLLTWSGWVSCIWIWEHAMTVFISSTSQFSTTLAEYKIVGFLCFNLLSPALRRRLGLLIESSRRLKSSVVSGNILWGERRADDIFWVTMHVENCLIWAVAIRFSTFKHVH